MKSKTLALALLAGILYIPPRVCAIHAHHA